MSAADLLDAEPVPVDLSIDPPTTPAVSAAADGPDQWEEPAPDVPEVPEAVVRGILASAGTVLGMSPLADPDVAAHWRFTEPELDALTPPMTRIVNARPALRQAAAHGDEMTIAVQLLGYTGRNLLTGAAAKKARRTETEEWERSGNLEPETDGLTPRSDGPTNGSTQPGPDPGAPGSVGYGVHPPAD